MAEITYLLGAGASYGALPIVSKMAEEIGETVKWLDDLYFQHRIPNKYSTTEATKFQNVLSDLRWLQEICDTSKNFSVDTFARKLHLSGKFDDYFRLKSILSFYFTLEQKRTPPDIRYDNFWASILKSKLEFPNNIKIVSWNYDFQLELTYQGFLGIDSLKIARKTLNVSSLESNSFKDPNDFGVFKLNGSATISSEFAKDTNYLIDNFSGSSIDQFIIDLVSSYETFKIHAMNINNHLSFAWEHTKGNCNIA